MEQDKPEQNHRPGPTYEERQRISRSYNVTPFVAGLVALGISGVGAIAAIAVMTEEKTAIIMIGLITTFCGTIISAVLLLTKLTEVKERMDGRLDELLEVTSKRQFQAGVAKGIEDEKQESRGKSENS